MSPEHLVAPSYRSHTSRTVKSENSNYSSFKRQEESSQ
uniref:Uncharacterized protein n=1 Tax=Parascaris equorum TaxID=6256 RepID=A0A914S045_PAREQ